MIAVLAMLYPSVSQLGVILTSRAHLAMSQTFLFIIPWMRGATDKQRLGLQL